MGRVCVVELILQHRWVMAVMAPAKKRSQRVPLCYHPWKANWKWRVNEWVSCLCCQQHEKGSGYQCRPDMKTCFKQQMGIFVSGFRFLWKRGMAGSGAEVRVSGQGLQEPLRKIKPKFGIILHVNVLQINLQT